MTGLLQSHVTRGAERHPEKVAVVLGEDRLTYGELEREANRIARLLAQCGCRRGERVCLLLPKCPAAVAAIHATLKADCVYVPIDIESPPPRIARIVAASEPRVLLVCAETVALAQELLTVGALVDEIAIGHLEKRDPQGSLKVAFDRRDIDAQDPEPLAVRNDVGDLAYLLFTSGSTGTPKGVGISHANVGHFVDWAVEYFGIESSERISSHPPLHFDLSTFDMYGAFQTGAELHLVPVAANRHPADLVGFMREHELTQWHSVPSALTFMANFGGLEHRDLPHLRRLLWCGEVLPTPTLIHWMQRLPHVRFTNLYGPTETTVASSFYMVPACPTDVTAPIPIGTPCAGEELYVLDRDMNAVPPGEIGELYIGGVGLSPGYWRDVEKTAAAFRVHPGTASGQVLYRTGDLGRVDADGLFHFVGRADSQIKSRGYRIELGEIEAALNADEQVRECAVVGVSSEGFEGTAICCAYAAVPGVELSFGELRRRLALQLPAYMLPSRWAAMERLPKNVNGKIDRALLRRHFEEQTSAPVPAPPARGAGGAIDRADDRAGTASAQDALAAFNGALLAEPADMEGAKPARLAAEVSEIWAGRLLAADPQERAAVALEVVRGQLAGVLGLGSGEAVEPDRVFGDLGVDSLAAVELRNRLGNVTGLRLPMTLVFDHPTAGAVAEFLVGRVLGGVSVDAQEVRVRRALASIPLVRLRSAGLLDVLLALAEEREVGVDDEGDGDVGGVDELDVESLVARALGVTAGAAGAGGG